VSTSAQDIPERDITGGLPVMGSTGCRPDEVRGASGIGGALAAIMKNIKKRLALRTETLRSLADQQLGQVGGGISAALCNDTRYCPPPQSQSNHAYCCEA
jgi:hypothetical protein